MKLDIACGGHKQKGFKGVDNAPGPDVDFVWDLERYPWELFSDNSFDEIYISHYVGYTKDLMKFMNEVWRISENDAKVTIVDSYYTSVRAWRDPMHVRTISEETWPYYNKGWRKQNGFDKYPIACDFSIEKMIVFFNPPWDKKSEEARQFAQQHYWNAVSDICVELKAIK